MLFFFKVALSFTIVRDFVEETYLRRRDLLRRDLFKQTYFGLKMP